MLLSLPGGKSVTVPGAFSGDFGVMLFYRGSWCPYCNAQLRAFQRASTVLTDAGIRAAALSVDDEATTAALSTSSAWPSRSASAPTRAPSRS